MTKINHVLALRGFHHRRSHNESLANRRCLGSWESMTKTLEQENGAEARRRSVL